MREQLRAKGSTVEGVSTVPVVHPMYTVQEIVGEGGVGALYKGLVPGLQHHFLSGGVKIGLYDPVKQMVETMLGSTTSPLLISGLSGKRSSIRHQFKNFAPVRPPCMLPNTPYVS